MKADGGGHDGVVERERGWVLTAVNGLADPGVPGCVGLANSASKLAGTARACFDLTSRRPRLFNTTTTTLSGITTGVHVAVPLTLLQLDTSWTVGGC